MYRKCSHYASNFKRPNDRIIRKASERVRGSLCTMLLYSKQMSHATMLALCAVGIALACYCSCTRHACSAAPMRPLYLPMRCAPEVVHVRARKSHDQRALLTLDVMLAPRCSVTLESSYYYALFDAQYDVQDTTACVTATNDHEQRVIKAGHPWSTRASCSVTLCNAQCDTRVTVRQTLLIKKMRFPLSLLAHLACVSARLALFPYALQ